MITAEDMKALCSQLVPALKKVTENHCLTDFTFKESIPDDSCQYWEYTLDFFDDYSRVISHSCGNFESTGRMLNMDLGIDQFFQNNDTIMEEFTLLTEQDVFEPLIPCLQEAKKLSGLVDVMISVEAHIRGGTEWLRGICDETILILHEHEKIKNTIDIGCQQSQRYQLKISNGNKITFLNIPFDKVNRFKEAERVEGYEKTPYYPYEVALSFAGEDRDYVQVLAKALKNKDIRVFYDDYEKVSLWGKDLYTHLEGVYRKNARFCVLFLSEHYKAKVWTNHERESAQARAFEENKDYILPVRLDDTEIPGILPTTGYIDGRSVRPEELANLIEKKLSAFD